MPPVFFKLPRTVLRSSGESAPAVPAPLVGSSQDAAFEGEALAEAVPAGRHFGKASSELICCTCQSNHLRWPVGSLGSRLEWSVRDNTPPTGNEFVHLKVFGWKKTLVVSESHQHHQAGSGMTMAAATMWTASRP